jgi:imidazolonepropionase-like amidohydrolase
MEPASTDPGLVDMHTHLLSDEDEYPGFDRPDELRVMVANGVTTVRFMIGTPELLGSTLSFAKGEIEGSDDLRRVAAPDRPRTRK